MVQTVTKLIVYPQENTEEVKKETATAVLLNPRALVNKLKREEKYRRPASQRSISQFFVPGMTVCVQDIYPLVSDLI